MADDLELGNDTTDPLSQNDILAALADDSDDSDETETEPVKLKAPAEDSEESEEEESEETEKDEEKEVKIGDDDDLEFEEVPNRQAILKAYPDIFKKFPGIQRAIYREDQYTKIFPSIKEAEGAKERLDTFSRVESDLLDGNIEGILSAVKQQNPKAFGKISGRLLETLSKVDQQSYFNTVNHVVKHAIKAAFENGKKMGGDDGEQLTIAAQLINKFIYNTVEVSDPAPLIQDEKEDPREQELTKREREFNESQLKTAVSDITEKTGRSIKSAVEKYIDPRGLMSSYVKSKAIDDVLTSVDKEIQTDSRFRNHLNKLWAESQKSGYSSESKDRIRKAIIAKAQGILPGYIKKVRADAVKSNSSRVLKKKDDVEQEPKERRTAPPSRSTPERKSYQSVASIMKALE